MDKIFEEILMQDCYDMSFYAEKTMGGKKKAFSSKAMPEYFKVRENRVQEHEKTQIAKSHFPCHMKELHMKMNKDEYIKATSEALDSCPICYEHVDRPHDFVVQKIRNENLFRQDSNGITNEIPFVKLIEYLIPESMDLEGCEIKMPETVFFQEGKPLFIAQTEKDGKMSKHNKWDCKAIRLKFT